MSDVERIIPPSPRRRQRARDEGQTARSAALTSSVLLGAAAACLSFQGAAILAGMASPVRTALSSPFRLGLSIDTATSLIRECAISVGLLAVWMVAGAWCVALAACIAQTGLIWSPFSTSPDMSRLAPASNWRRMVSTDSVFAAAWGVAVVVGTTAMTGLLLMLNFGDLIGPRSASTVVAVRHVLGRAGQTFLELTAVLISLAAIDVAWRRWKLEESLRMTREEAREETDVRKGSRRGRPR